MADVTVKIGADAAELNSTLGRIDQRMRSFGSGMASQMAVIASSIASAFTVREIYQAGLTLEKLKAQLSSMEGPLGDVNGEMERLKNLAKLPGLDLESAVQGTVRLRAVGMSAEESRETIGELANALGLVGGSTEDMNGVIYAFGQIQAKGKVFAEEINQINERLPQIRVLMKQAFGTSNTEDLAKMGLTSEQFIRGITEEMKTLPRAANTAQTSIKNLGDAMSQALGTIGAAALKQAQGGIELLVTKITELAQAMDWMVNGEQKASAATKASLVAHMEKTRSMMEEARTYGELMAAYERHAAGVKIFGQQAGGMTPEDFAAVKTEMQAIAAEFAKLNDSGATSMELKKRQLEDWIGENGADWLKSLASFVTPGENKNPFVPPETLDAMKPVRFDVSSAVSDMTRVGGARGFNFPNLAQSQLTTAKQSREELVKQTTLLKSIDRKVENTKAVFS